jgi:hypothetical protein
MQAGIQAGRQASMQTSRQARMQASMQTYMQASIVVCRIEYVYHIGVCIVVRLIVVCVWHDIVVFDAGHNLISHWVNGNLVPNVIQDIAACCCLL